MNIMPCNSSTIGVDKLYGCHCGLHIFICFLGGTSIGPRVFTDKGLKFFECELLLAPRCLGFKNNKDTKVV